jgi:hypothetical protein
VPFDLDVDVLTSLAFQLADNRINARLRLVGQIGLVEFEVPLIFAQADFIDKLASGRDVGIGRGEVCGNLVDFRVDLTRSLLRGVRRGLCRFG